MSLKIRFPKCIIRFLTFIAYNLFYVLYMMECCTQTLYLATLVLFCCMNLFCILVKGGRFKKSIREFKLGIGYVLVFFIISVFVQVLHMDFEMYLVNGLVRIALPIINAFLFVNSVDEEDQQCFFNVLLARFVLHFVWENYNNFNLAGFSSISWNDSSSDMESSLAHDFIIMEMYYLYKNSKKKALLCVLLCMLSMKRISFVLAPILYVISNRVPKGVKVKNTALNIVKIIVIISPFVILGMYTNTFQNWFNETFNVSLNTVMSGRPEIYRILNNNIPYYNGYGSANNFLDNYVTIRYGTTWNTILHNDFLRIYLETTIRGIVVLANNLVNLTKKEYWHFLMICYLLLVAITSHILNYFSVWITFYLVIMSYSDSSVKSLINN